MVQARGIQIRENVKNIGAQVLEQVVRGAYSINGTGKYVRIQPYLNVDRFSIIYFKMGYFARVTRHRVTYFKFNFLQIFIVISFKIIFQC